MPIIKSAKKKLRQDEKRTKINLISKKKAKEAIKEFKKKPTQTSFTRLSSILDTLSKKKIFHMNKSSRLKSRLSKLLTKAPQKSKEVKKVKKTKKTSL
ncbi:MAG: 30S ribosomal protein S20 [Candidatus Gottesmanbacteria bacterium GW2011_GWA2_41_12]|uniref:Small ribosomal subunit protein bS20 n=1 Tax=Candidatus Gottesmanbacteria bacterium GW2011_GWA2_41_12 TaxID=1618440 RepID=A0A0G0ULJ7_9BACT|nr:MAG: 30S ribosomal protein S20 [Candidatus Gottesmanbacteria bacterium GW2011_GWA2_41_12]